MKASFYKNKPTIVLETAALRAEFIPQPGAKLASLINRKTGYEFMVQKPWETYREQPYAGCFVDAECSGFDEMFPTIDDCRCEAYPWQGSWLPDHGEVWSLPWTVEEATDTELVMSVHGVRFPYRLRKSISVLNDTTLAFSYELQNLSAYDFEYLWAGHMMINLQEGTKISVPKACCEAVSVLSQGSAKFAEVQHWPNLKDAAGNLYSADVARPASCKGFEKIYFPNRLTDGWCQLDYPDGNVLRTTFDAPYLGLLINEDGWDNLYNIIIEPCSICFDRPDLAKKFGQVSVLPGDGTLTWGLTLSVDTAEK